MAEWRARGYVPDSDEEDGSQDSERRATVASEEGFKDIDLLYWASDNQLGEGTSENKLGLQEELGEGEDQNEDGDIDSPYQGIEKENATVAATADKHSQETLRNTIDREPIYSLGLSRDSENIDELQQDHYPSTPVARLETQLNSNVHLHNEEFNLRNPSESFQQAVRSLSSSPLSEPLPSSPRDLPRVAQWLSPPRVQGNHGNVLLPPSSINREVSGAPDQDPCLDYPLRDGTVEQYRVRRNLRHRNPIQLHPYAIESEKYRQILKARGVKPLRIAQIEMNLAHAKKQDTQEQDFYCGDDSQLVDHDVDSQDLVTASSPSAHNPTVSHAQGLSDIFQFEGDDLPDMDSLLRQPRQLVATQGNKRRKTMHTFSKKEKRRTIQQDLNLPIPPSNMHPVDDDSMFDVPPSPPQSGSPTPTYSSIRSKDVFRFPQELSPIALPTPVTSSEPRKRRPIELFDDSASNDDSRIMPINKSSADSELGSSSSENEGDSQFERVQRKIKGVLPASWLKLDLKANPKKPINTTRISRSTSPVIRDHRGVARPVTGLSSRSPDAPADSRLPNDISEDEDSDLESTRLPSTATSKQRLPRFYIRDDLDDQRFSTANNGEVEEDNRVDAMLPSDKEPVTHLRKHKSKRQTTSRHVALRPFCAVGDQALQGSRSNVTQQPRITHCFEKNRKKTPKFRVPKLSILDVPTQDQFLQKATPQFLKVASRTARSRKDRGRHSPSRKFLRLAAADDTNEANETLRCWREGILAKAPLIPAKDHSKESCRQPLYPRSHNSQLPQVQLNFVGTEDEVPRFSYKARPAGYISTSKKPRMIQRSLDNLIQRRITPQIQPHNDPQQMKHGKGKLNIKKRGQLLSLLQTNWESRPALLESLQEEEDQLHRVSAFKRDLKTIDQNQNKAGASTMLLGKFLVKHARLSLETMGSRLDPDKSHKTNRTGAEDGPERLPRRKRKRLPRRIDIGASKIRQASASLLVGDELDRSIAIAVDDPQERVLVRLGSLGIQYTIDFDVKPLSKGTCFHECTFLGSGEFLKSLNMTRYNDLDRHRGFMSLSLASKTYRWGPWNDQVSGQLVQVFDILCQKLRLASSHNGKTSDDPSREQIISFLRNIIRYLSDHQSFLDPVDRKSHLQKWKDLALMVFREMDDDVSNSRSRDSSPKDEAVGIYRIQLSTLLLVVLNQLRQISQHHLVQPTLKDEINSILMMAARRSVTQALEQRFVAFRRLLENLRPLESSIYTIREGHHPIEALVVTQHILAASTGSMAAFWNIANEQILVQNSGKVKDVRVFEDQWQKLYTMLPFLEFDAQGILESGERFRNPLDNWTPVKRMISQVLQVYMSNVRIQPSNYNIYCRALYSRCFYLINSWGWQRCESVIGTLFDFFGRSNLAHLRNEESHGSAQFLEHLDQQRPLEISATDRCFHILLKIIGSGLKCMRQIYPEKKVRDVVWRLMPNHGRNHPKEEAIRQEDLDALRNHHDLLCTLYWAAAPGIRPRLSIIRNLVHLESSHREACHISIRAWSNLVKFQLSTAEPVSSLKPFAEWHSDLLGQILRQHALARTEAEEQFKSSHYSKGLTISKDLLESTISRNQQQIEAILSDALTSLRRAIKDARTLEAAGALLTPTMTHVLMFDARRPQINRVVIEALDVLLAYVGHYSESSDSQESQDYGDWSGFSDGVELGDNDGGSSPKQMAKRLEEDFHESLKQLLSNCFGADTVPNDTILLKLIEVWVSVARCLVHHGAKSWSDYIDRFGHDSWTSLRDTEQTRKWTAYFLALLMEMDNEIYQEKKFFFVTSWITSLVERESMLKFQHRLTSALLNLDRSDPLLGNLPFSTNKSTDLFEITATEFSQRRLSLISSLLSNMRESLDEALCTSTIDAAKLKQDYKDLLKHLMLTMKQRYQELGHGPSVRGTYVDFVHRVIEFLQQHTSTICPVDRFFMDSAVFPLPATDPTYVIGQLKSYGLRFQDSRTPKQLAVFLQSVSERAVVDGQQEYLVAQLHAALAGTFEYGEAKRPTLRAVVVNAVVPAYVEVAFNKTSGWLLALPMLQALQKVFRELLPDLDGTDPASVAAVLSTITVFLDGLRSGFHILVDHSRLLEQPRVLKTLAVCYSAITATLSVLEYITRLSGHSQHAIACIDFFKSFGIFTSELLLGHSDVSFPEIDGLEPLPPDHQYADIRKFALHELRETLNKNWICDEEHYQMVRGQSRREIMVDIGSNAEEKELLMREIKGFEECLGAMPGLRGNDGEDVMVSRFKGISLDEILLS